MSLYRGPKLYYHPPTAVGRPALVCAASHGGAHRDGTACFGGPVVIRIAYDGSAVAPLCTIHVDACGGYQIELARLWPDPEWYEHLSRKNWRPDLILDADGWSLHATPWEKPARPAVRRELKPSTRFRILSRDGFRCQACGRTAAEDKVELHVDHKHPISRGGTNDVENLWTLCADCNLGKGARVL